MEFNFTREQVESAILACDRLSNAAVPGSHESGFWAGYRAALDALLNTPPRLAVEPVVVRCFCGYEATSPADFDQHVVAMMHDAEPHRPQRP